MGAVRLERLIGDVSVVPGAEAPVLSVAFATRGSAQVLAGDVEHSLPAGAVCVADTPLALRGEALRAWLLTVEPGGVCARASSIAPGLYAVDASHRPRCEAFFDALGDELRRGGGCDGAAVEALVELILLCCSRAADGGSGDGGSVKPGSERLAGQVLDVIDRRFAERLSLADIAGELSRSSSGVARAVREATGSSVLELIAERRLREARSLLIGTELSVGEIAARVGYPSLGYFHRVFRRAHATTPQRWRTGVRLSEPALGATG